MRRLLPRLLPALLPLAFLLWTGVRGVDFQKHWDERQMVLVVRDSIEEGRRNPGWYHYPSMCFRLARAALWPKVLAGASTDQLVEETKKWRYRLRVRTVFLVVSALALLWVYGALLAAGRSVAEALLAAGILATSWQWTYHARWFAPDAVTAQFGALALLGLALAEVSGRRSGLWIAALGAGLATATKYTGGVFLFPALIAAWRGAGRDRTTGERRRDVLAALVLFGGTFLAVTPGALVETARFLEDVRFEMTHYREMGHYGHTVEPGLGLAARMVRFVARDLASPSEAASLAAVGLALVGALAFARRRPRLLALWLVGPTLLFLTLTSQRVLFVRNLLPLLPLLAILAAIGVGTLAARLSRRAGPALVLAGGALLVAPGVPFNLRAAESIRRFDALDPARDLAAWMRAHPDRVVLARPSVADALGRLEAPPPARVDRHDPDVELVAFTIDDHPAPGRLPSNVPGRTVAWFGPRDVDLEYYTAWLEPWIFLVPLERAESWNVFERPKDD